MENNIMRALTIAFATLMFALTLSGIIAYYNAAVTSAQALNDRSEISKENLDIVTNTEITNVTLSGTEMRSLIKKYMNNNKVQINLTIGITTSNNINNDAMWKNSIGNMSEAKMSVIIPNKDYSIVKTVSAAITTLTATEQ